jgi:hypothetical protein
MSMRMRWFDFPFRMTHIFLSRKMRMDKRFSMMVIALVDMKQGRGNQRKKHCAHRDTSAESMHGQSFSCTYGREVNGCAVLPWSICPREFASIQRHDGLRERYSIIRMVW